MAIFRPILWGHSLDEYQKMFGLAPDDLQQSIIDCGAGPASFCAELTPRNDEVVAIDPMYDMAPELLAEHVKSVFKRAVDDAKAHSDWFVWDEYPDLDHLVAAHEHSLEQFLTDFEKGREAQRYRANTVIDMPYGDGIFDLALCSHHLFGHGDHVGDMDYHIAALKEMVRVAKEVRVFPLTDHSGQVSELIGPLILLLQEAGIGVEMREVPYQVLRNSNAVLRLWAQSCEVS